MPDQKNKAKLIETKCATCGSPIVRPAWRFRDPAKAFCNHRCAGKQVRPPRSTPRPVGPRFWKQVDKKDEGCWEWTGRSKRTEGYGVLSVRNTNQGAHRVSWEIHNGPIPHGMKVLHKCDNPPCVNPDHLFLGTTADNTADMIRKGRGRFNPAYPPLTAAHISEIRQRFANGESARSIAKQYHRHRRTIERIVSGKRYAHLHLQ